MASTSDAISSTVVIDIEKLANSRKLPTRAEKMQKVMVDMERKHNFFGTETEKNVYTINRVFDSIRKEGERDYEPQIISIGPIHHGKEALKPMEVLKWKYLSELIRRNPEKNTLENYMETIRPVEEFARNSYSESVKLGDDFLEMMVLDGCFLIEFFVKAYDDESLNELILSRNLPLLRRDLLLLENQIPFFILRYLFNSSNITKPSTLTDLIVGYVTSDRFSSSLFDRFISLHEKYDVGAVHLLHVYHSRFQLPPNYHGSPYTLAKKMKMIRRLAAAPFLLLLSCLLTCKIPITNFWVWRRREFFHPPITEIPSATQLDNSGVNFKKSPRAGCLVDVTFDKEEGILKIPVFSLHENEISTFCNMIAFEKMKPGAGNCIRSHALLMACLIRTTEDVAILRDRGIIESMFKKDIHVVEVFDRFLRGSYLDFHRLDNHYQQMFKDVSEYCSVVHHKWRADLKRTYFGSPWTVASLIAAILVLLLTFAQTFYTIYAYHHPPST